MCRNGSLESKIERLEQERKEVDRVVREANSRRSAAEAEVALLKQLLKDEQDKNEAYARQLTTSAGECADLTNKLTSLRREHEELQVRYASKIVDDAKGRTVEEVAESERPTQSRLYGLKLELPRSIIADAPIIPARFTCCRMAADAETLFAADTAGNLWWGNVGGLVIGSGRGSGVPDDLAALSRRGIEQNVMQHVHVFSGIITCISISKPLVTCKCILRRKVGRESPVRQPSLTGSPCISDESRDSIFPSRSVGDLSAADGTSEKMRSDFGCSGHAVGSLWVAVGTASGEVLLCQYVRGQPSGEVSRARHLGGCSEAKRRVNTLAFVAHHDDESHAKPSFFKNMFKFATRDTPGQSPQDGGDKLEPSELEGLGVVCGDDGGSLTLFSGLQKRGVHRNHFHLPSSCSALCSVLEYACTVCCVANAHVVYVGLRNGCVGILVNGNVNLVTPGAMAKPLTSTDDSLSLHALSGSLGGDAAVGGVTAAMGLGQGRARAVPAMVSEDGTTPRAKVTAVPLTNGPIMSLSLTSNAKHLIACSRESCAVWDVSHWVRLWSVEEATSTVSIGRADACTSFPLGSIMWMPSLGKKSLYGFNIGHHLGLQKDLVYGCGNGPYAVHSAQELFRDVWGTGEGLADIMMHIPVSNAKVGQVLGVTICNRGLLAFCASKNGKGTVLVVFGPVPPVPSKSRRRRGR